MCECTISKANIFFDGKVTNRDVIVGGKVVKSVGIMLLGRYKWQADVAEKFRILQGNGSITIGKEEPIIFEPGDFFTVPANEIFEFSVENILDYEVTYE